MPTGAEIFSVLFTTGGGWIAIIALLALLGVIFKWFGSLGQNKAFIVGAVSTIVLIIGLFVAGIPQMFGIFGTQTFAALPEAIIPPEQVEKPQTLTQPAPQDNVGVGGECRFVQNTHELKTAIKNLENASSLGYLAGSIAAESDGITHDTGTATSGATLSYTSLNVPPCKAGSIYVLGTSGVGTASARMAFTSFPTVSEYQIQGAAQDVIAVQGYDRQGNTRSNGLANGSTTIADQFISGAGTTDGTAYYRNTTLAQGGTLQGQLGYDTNGTSTVFGNYGLTTYNKATGQYEHNALADDGVIFSFDSVDASKFSSSSFTLNQIDDISLKSVPCPATIVANRNAEACWKARTLSATDGEVLLKFQLSADVGDPIATGDNPVLCVDDKVYFRDADGQIKYDFYSAGGTNQGVAGVCLTFVVA